jgi:hypothetical protein
MVLFAWIWSGMLIYFAVRALLLKAARPWCKALCTSSMCSGVQQFHACLLEVAVIDR